MKLKKIALKIYKEIFSLKHFLSTSILRKLETNRHNQFNILYIKSIPKEIWIYWSHSEENAPFIVKQCIKSWRNHNPDWNIKVLNAESLNEYLLMPSLPECLPERYHANLIRTMLLNKYGGVWADATTYCHRPLSEWLPLLSFNGFFMFSNPSDDRDIENWFIASTPNHPLVSAWQNRLEKYYLKMKKIHPAYFLAFYIYQWMIEDSDKLKKQEQACSKINAIPCLLMKSVLLNNTPFYELEKHLKNGLPLSKLDWRLEITDKEIFKYL
jgi:mannosyltransferase OCH1-like enzyme